METDMTPDVVEVLVLLFFTVIDYTLIPHELSSYTALTLYILTSARFLPEIIIEKINEEPPRYQ